MSGGEPLFPEQEAKVQETWNRVLVWRQCSPSEPSLKEILRAFAREILQSTEKALEQSIAQRVDLLRAADRQGAALLASQESCRLLAEALEDVLKNAYPARSTASDAWVKARTLLRAYRSSEAGKEKV